MRHYIKYFGVFLLIAPLWIIGDFISRKVNPFILVGLAIILSVLLSFAIFDYLSIHGQGDWKIITSKQTQSIN